MNKKVTIWNYIDYKDYIKSRFSSRERAGRGQFSKLAKHLNVHSTYISQVINGPKDFNGEQALAVSHYLNLLSNEENYFLELVYFARAGTTDLKEFHLRKINILKDEATKVSSRVGTSKELSDDQKIRYYSDWTYVSVWLGSSIKSLNDHVSLSQFLKISPSQAHEVLDFLMESGLCTFEDDKLQMKIKKTHIPADSILVKNHHLNWRLKSIEASQRLDKKELMFTAPISISKKDFEKVKIMILDLIENITEVVKNTEPEVIACLNFDQILVGGDLSN